MVSNRFQQVVSTCVSNAPRRTAALVVGVTLLGACADSTSPRATPDANTSYSFSADVNESAVPASAVMYINPDLAGPVPNPDVNPNSSCFTPDTKDTQTLSPVGTTTNNVHTDACFFDSGRSQKLDEPASFESRGVGVISACPDPDGTGPKVSILSVDKKRCFQSGYQDNGLTGNDEFHARMNNDGTAGMQRVVWCYDPENNGCADSRVKSDTRINWVS